MKKYEEYVWFKCPVCNETIYVKADSAYMMADDKQRYEMGQRIAIRHIEECRNETTK